MDCGIIIEIDADGLEETRWSVCAIGRTVVMVTGVSGRQRTVALPMIESIHRSHAGRVQQMFTQISGRYDLMNRLMSAGQDLRWRRLAVRAAGLAPGDLLLDVAAGTGDVAFIAQSQVTGVQVVAADLNVDMMRVGRRRGETRRRRRGVPGWTAADTYALPFARDRFDAVASAFLLRNLADPLAGLAEQTRVLKPGRRLVVLDATPPPDNWLRPFVNLHLNRVIPAIGRLVTRHRDAYHYFPRSVAGFLEPEAIAELLIHAGLTDVTYRSFMAGAAAMVVGTKPADRWIPIP